MNIPRILISNFFARQVLFWAAAVPVAGIALHERAKGIQSTNNEIGVIKAEVFQIAPSYYKHLETQASKLGLMDQKNLWSAGLAAAKDSIRVDSMIQAASQRAYFEGAQMVRDSIANAKK